jgi:hypothetical protein
MRCTVLLAVVLSGVVGANALAQANAPVQPGQRVRVRSTVTSTPELTGVVEAVRPDTLLVRDDDRSVATAVPLPTVDRLQVSLGRHSHWVRGAGIGFVVGAVTGAVLGAAGHNEEDVFFGPGATAFMGAILLSPIGAATGALVGLMVKTERWETVSLDRVAPTVSGGLDGRLSVGLRLTF